MINDRVDVALAAEADGVHIGQDDMAPADARLLLGTDRDHRPERQDRGAGARAAPLDLLDYVAIGGVYGTTSKDNTATPIGIAGLARYCRSDSRSANRTIPSAPLPASMSAMRRMSSRQAPTALR